MDSFFLPPSIDGLHKALAFVRAASRKAGVLDSDLWKVELATEEAVVNIIRHGHLEDEGIEIHCYSTEEGFVMTFKDPGMPYDPTAAQAATQVEDVIGGKGLNLIKKSMDRIVYVREGKYNILTMIKFL